jgi:hypothetical protein
VRLRVDHGKGAKDRFAMLELRDWWRIVRPAVWMFPGCDRINNQPDLHREARSCFRLTSRAG